MGVKHGNIQVGRKGNVIFLRIKLVIILNKIPDRYEKVGIFFLLKMC